MVPIYKTKCNRKLMLYVDRYAWRVNYIVHSWLLQKCKTILYFEAIRIPTRTKSSNILLAMESYRNIMICKLPPIPYETWSHNPRCVNHTHLLTPLWCGADHLHVNRDKKKFFESRSFRHLLHFIYIRYMNKT